MLPDFDPDGTLPPGIHWATWPEVTERFGFTAYRQELLDGLKRALDVLHIAGCRTVYLDGSFITAKPIPNDFDVCWVRDGVDLELLDPELLDFQHGRAAQKLRYGGELLPIHSRRMTGKSSLLTFFQTNRETGAPKGILAIDIGIWS
jgi:Family of unknown function (DUF6932)